MFYVYRNIKKNACKVEKLSFDLPKTSISFSKDLRHATEKKIFFYYLNPTKSF